LVGSLLFLAEARQASLSEATLQLYAAELAAWPPEDVNKVLRAMAYIPRRDGETAFPELGQIVERIKAIGRYRRAEEQGRTERDKCEAWFWQWVSEQVEDTGKTEQAVLDGVKYPGFTGRKARNGSQQNA
jgi:hypothetical protein